MLDILDQSLRSSLPDLLKMRENWDSLIVNRRKPYTYRVFTTLETGCRICLHRFDPCHDHEAFPHPHPWPGAFIVMSGSYLMKVGLSFNREDKNPVDVARFVMRKFATYEITSPLTWHSVIPLEPTYTIMVNGPPFPDEMMHVATRRTKGKDLDKMPENELLEHLKIFSKLVAEYNDYSTGPVSVGRAFEVRKDESMEGV